MPQRVGAEALRAVYRASPCCPLNRGVPSPVGPRNWGLGGDGHWPGIPPNCPPVAGSPNAEIARLPLAAALPRAGPKRAGWPPGKPAEMADEPPGDCRHAEVARPQADAHHLESSTRAPLPSRSSRAWSGVSSPWMQADLSPPGGGSGRQPGRSAISLQWQGFSCNPRPCHPSRPAQGITPHAPRAAVMPNSSEHLSSRTPRAVGTPNAPSGWLPERSDGSAGCG